MAKQLPAPALVSSDLDIVSSQIEQRSPTSSNLQRGLRAGSHYIGRFVSEPLAPDAARQWLDLRVEGDTVVMGVPQLDLEIGEPGTTLVNGSGQAGSNLAIKGFAAGYVVRKGQAFNHIGSDGVRRTYVAESAVTANASGLATVPLETMLTWPPGNNDVVSFSDVRIEGFATVERGSWLQDGNGYQTLSFSIEERG